ncbi:hypothetical protein MHC_01470 [Mycoplasma haemocanis str. Illinois]|uniref:Uncharacterized protein n=1 Tax=Mycoplasma haemocanis (strain Illinois) TaxID=1111676 RepID=H6N688_MYCHN|nr:hypothetical protein [Mycoplasma haemocanis]AEW45160.1 hypothetical protein MHC_01470 [Mycoplasma haemocanis str. Illinois]
MSKLTPVAFLLSGAGGIAGSYYVSPKQSSKTVSSKLNTRFRDKYKFPLLQEQGDEDIWKSKWELLKTGKPTHKKLLEAIKIKDQEKKSQDLHKEGCQDIYNSKVITTPYLSDFTLYCSKTNKDAIGKGKWISEDFKSQPKGKTNAWDEPLEKLRKTEKKDLDYKLSDLYNQIKDTKVNLEEKHRKTLKEWCDSIAGGMFLGEEKRGIGNAKNFCIGK